MRGSAYSCTTLRAVTPSELSRTLYPAHAHTSRLGYRCILGRDKDVSTLNKSLTSVLMGPELVTAKHWLCSSMEMGGSCSEIALPVLPISQISSHLARVARSADLQSSDLSK